MATDVRRTMSDNDTEARCTQGKRTIFYKWDDVNCRLIARYYLAREYMIRMQEFVSDLMVFDPPATRGNMRRSGDPQYFGKGFIRELSEVLEIQKRRESESDEDYAWGQVMKLAESYGLIRTAYGGVALLTHPTVAFEDAVDIQTEKAGL